LCFFDHLRNIQEGMGVGRTLKQTWYQIPSFYFACPSTILGPYEDVPMAPGSAWQDFELEIGAVIGIGGQDLTVSQAEEAIIGYTIFNDWSARDLQLLERALEIGLAKGKDSAITLGPCLVTSDELKPYIREGRLDLAVTALVNDREIGSGSAAQMDWTFGELISYASRGVPLRPGEIFGSGTVPTCTLLEHLSMTDPMSFVGWLKPGDVVTLRVEGLGEVRQTIRATPPPFPLAPRPNPDVQPAAPRTNNAPSRFPYTKGLHQVGDGAWAWLAPNGGFGWSNAGLIVGDGASLLVDTLFDLHLTREMLEAMAPITARAPITQAFVTHSNGDHFHGNQLLDPSVQVITAKETAHEIADGIAPEMLAMMQVMDFDPVMTRYLRERFGPFDFNGITLRDADRTFDRDLVVDVGGTKVNLLNLGPAHTAADSVVHVPDAGVLFAGDLLFIGGTPIVWAGPIDGWIAACDKLIALDAPTVVPGHGPVTDPDGIRAVRGYLVHIREQADALHSKGLSLQEAVDAVDLGEYGDWLDAERVVANIYNRYRELDPNTPELGPIALFGMMAHWFAKHAGAQ
jgi:2-keto-4-pentenoate hydratase/2-oxohepta-3-ene-1,7-dioic acid hydratase in catechol pathway/glyoxylase-like metal-dependent hydrolase (beta-lactamase superfamily II)